MAMNDYTKGMLFRMLAAAVGNASDDASDEAFRPLTVKEWNLLADAAIKHNVAPLAADGMWKLKNREGHAAMRRALATLDTPELEELKYRWLGSGLQMEMEHERYIGTVERLCRLYADKGFEPVLLKGLGMGMNYPNPVLRPVGDIDVYVLGGRCREADQMMLREGIKVAKSKAGHHSHLEYEGILVENHHELSNTYSRRRQSVVLEQRLQELIATGCWKPKEGCPYWLPSADFNAVFLMWHMATHFTNELNPLRQLLDWMMFLRVHHGEVDWQRVTAIWEDAGLKCYADGVNSLLVKYMWMDLSWVPTCRMDEALAQRIAEDSLRGYHGINCMIINMLRYPKRGWKYRLTGGRNWIGPMMESMRMHLFHINDLKEFDVQDS